MSVGQHWLDLLTQLIDTFDLEVGLGIHDHPSTIQFTTPKSGLRSLGNLCLVHAPDGKSVRLSLWSPLHH